MGYYYFAGFAQVLGLHNHTDVPAEFVVPTRDDAWPELTWGHRLGNTVTRIRRKGGYAAQVAKSKDELDEMAFCYDMTLMDRDWEEKILPSIRVYRQEFGDCIIPRAFVVPSSAPWPEKAWRKPLGMVVNEMRFRKAFAEQAARDKGVLDALGFAWDRSDALWNEIVIPALKVYVDTCKNGKVPPQFVVPSEDPWPSQAWGKRYSSNCD